ncbi:cytochrome c oxidase assembly protein [Kiloniella sp. b19]|uniref:cytochrome c oxidase assembly protein n=1 Tax=Kiloniella sp. GXU_MW_B19 TaxID=3141326 RepID=UPI0031D113F2
MTLDPRSPQPDRLAQASARNKRMAMILALMVGGMVGMAYAAVPLYELFCKVTGYGGTPQQSDVASEEILDRTMKIRFDSSVNGGMPWEFQPAQRQVEIRVGESGLAFYRAKNTSERPVRGVATFNVTPLKAGPYFVKIDCFCFTEQTLLPGEEVDMPVTFYVDPSIEDETNMDEVQTITLSYTFFEEALEEEQELSLQSLEDNIKNRETLEEEG